MKRLLDRKKRKLSKKKLNRKKSKREWKNNK